MKVGLFQVLSLCLSVFCLLLKFSGKSYRGSFATQTFGLSTQGSPRGGELGLIPSENTYFDITTWPWEVDVETVT